MVFLSLVLVPALKQGTGAEQRRLLFQRLGRRFRAMVWTSIAVLVTTGPLLLAARGLSVVEPAGWPFVLSLKLILVAGLVGLTAAHDFWLGPFVGRLLAGSVSNRNRYETFMIRLAPWVARLALGVALLILLLAVALART